MNKPSWTEKKQALAQKYGKAAHIVIAIRRGLIRNRLSTIKQAVYYLHKNTDSVPAVVAQLNKLLADKSLTARWYKNKNDQSGQLLIRNHSVGLLAKTAANEIPEGIMRTAGTNNSMHKVTAQAALSVLSSHMRRAHVMHAHDDCALKFRRKD